MALDAVPVTPRTIESTASSPRISFSADFLEEASNSVSSSSNPRSNNAEEKQPPEKEREKPITAAEFEFLSDKEGSNAMLTADELFFNGKLLPFWQMQHSEKLNKISLKPKNAEEEQDVLRKEEGNRVSWFLDDDPSPRPPKCTVLWKELLRLKKQRASSLYPSSSPASSSSSSLSVITAEEQRKGGSGSGNREKHVKRVKKGLERTSLATFRIRPMITVPICTQMKTSAFPPLFPLPSQEKKIREMKAKVKREC